MVTAGERRPAAEPLRAAMELLGDHWTLLILQSVFLRVRRYGDIAVRLRVSPSTLSARLRDLLEAGVLTREPYRDEGRTRAEYRLTEKGLALWSLLVAIWSWQRAWVPSHVEGLPELVHLDCGSPTTAPLGCSACGRAVELRSVGVNRLAHTATARASTHRRFRRGDWDRLADDPLLYFRETMELLGDRWTTGVLVTAFLGAHHFSEFERELAIPPSVLSGRLARLAELDVLATTNARTKADALAYRLTPKGRAFLPALALIVTWARDHARAGTGMLVTLTHGCDHELEPTLLCEHCGSVLERPRVRFTS